MIKFSIQQLARIIKAKLSIPSKGFFTGISIDSRTIKAGDCFFAIPGGNFDGHKFVADVLAEKALCAVVKDNFDEPRCKDKVLLKVKDTIESLGIFAAEYRRGMNLKVVAITGSVGKTTTRQIIAHVLGKKYKVLQSPKSFNNNIGLPLTLLSAEPSHQVAVVELGSNHPGEIAYLTRIAQPDIAIVTNAHPAHLEGFGSLRNIVKEKLSISQGLSPSGEFIINGDLNYLTDYARQSELKFSTFGTSASCDVRACDIAFDNLNSSFVIEGCKILLPLPGQGNVENALAAWAICRKLDIRIEDFASAIKDLPPVSMRAEILQLGNLKVINDCYNANPASMKNALQILSDLGSSTKARTVFICGDMGELGQQSEQLHNELGLSIAKARVNLLIAIGAHSKLAAQSAKNNADYPLQTFCFDNNLCARDNLHQLLQDSDIILVKGSRSAKLEMIVDKIKQLFAG